MGIRTFVLIKFGPYYIEERKSPTPRKGADPPNINQQQSYNNIIFIFHRAIIQFIFDLQYKYGFVRPISVTKTNRILSICLPRIDPVKLLFQTKEIGSNNILTIHSRWIKKIQSWTKKLVEEMSQRFSCKVSLNK